jgi:hypothetical protein
MTASKKRFEIYTLEAPQIGAWNLCHLRQTVYAKHFEKHMCSVLTLDFGFQQDVERFQKDMLELRSRARGFSLAPPPVSRRSSSSWGAMSAEMSGARSVTDHSSILDYNVGLDDDIYSRGYTVPSTDAG